MKMRKRKPKMLGINSLCVLESDAFPDKEISRELLKKAIYKIFRTVLSVDERIVIYFSFGIGIDPKKTKEIAETLRTTPKKVVRLKHQALIKLRAKKRIFSNLV